MPTAAEAADLVDTHTPLALLIARQWGRVYPWLADDFASDAPFTLWRVASANDPARGPFGGLVRVAVGRAMRARLRSERAVNPTAFRRPPSAGGEHLDPLDLVAGREPPVGVALEVSELLARLPEDRRAELERHYRDGETFREIGAARGVTGNAVRQSVAAAVARLLKDVGGDGT